MKPRLTLPTALVVACIATSSTVRAEPAVPPFYQSVMRMKPEGKLGQVLKKEKVETPVQGAQAWRIAYVSSDLNDRKTISTGLVVAPTGPT
ncbi:MAG: hypothetical protein ACKO2K_09215, partial [Alphaproteobacteria bacterium]